MKTILTFCAVALTVLPCSANKNRGVWFWASSSSPYGSANIVGSTNETETLNFFKSHGIKKVYGSYQNRSVSEPGTIVAWNTKLHAEGIESQFLMSENTWIFPVNQASFLSKITDRLIDFNNGRPAVEQFDGLHLDIEPQALPEWGDEESPLTPTEKRDYLNLLRDMYGVVRTHFVTNGLPDFPIYADLPVWFDSSASIGWIDTAERDDWFEAISTNLTGISLMSFERDSFSSVDSGVNWERTNITNATVRTGLESDIGDTWPTSFDFNVVMEEIEANYGNDATDIQSYKSWRQSLADESFGGVEVGITNIPGTLTAELDFDNDTNFTYAVLHSTNLCNWLETDRYIAPENGITNYTVATSNNVGFWKIQRLIPLESE